MKSNTTTVEAYLAELTPEQRSVIEPVRQTILQHLPAGFVESFAWGMLSYEVPLARFPDTYNQQPLSYVALAAQKKHYSLYLMCVAYDEPAVAWLQAQFRQAGKKFDMGKSCLRFRKLDDLPLAVVAEVIQRYSVDEYIGYYQAMRREG
ncbi:iron chaperone [Herpetosiphon geysericola]|uniref:YdhG-like domain-containing protein n=1 Tax=Herpetosiphon geysericola TaxID=70996 RepID=A0A0P6XPR4_9CHLR|nr:DUF1801 domain-containing protein [Herpetosiphon geysericola]KPL85851.1 hypothetical protein SE18_13055 [Herpetosiphon geysericola]